jgi:hypothetical protein
MANLDFRWVGLILAANFANGPRPYHSGLPSPIFRPTRKFCLIQRLNTPQQMPWAPFLEPSFTDTYATCEYVKLGVKPGPTFKLVTQAHHGGYPMVV